VLAVVGLALAGCATAPGPVDLDGVEVRAEVAFVGAPSADVDELAIARAGAMSRLGTELVATKPGENMVVSPVSVLLAFAMLREGASGQTADELDAMFAFDPAEPGEAIATLRANLAGFDGDVSLVDSEEPPAEPLLHVADALFAAPDVALGPEFLDRIARFHDAGVFEADFAAKKAKPLLDAWVARETGGLIDEAPNDPDPDTKLALFNAVVFAAQWQRWFDVDETTERPFTLADGSDVTVDMMTGVFEVRYAARDGWRAVELPYAAGFAMLLALPDEGSGPLSVEQWAAVREEFAPASDGDLPLDEDHSPELDLSVVALWLPRWEFGASLDLMETLGPLGLAAPFDDRGELYEVFPGGYVTDAAHTATITVAESGTVAAAITQIAMTESAAPVPNVELRLDRPFDFQIVASTDQLPLFTGHVANPAE